jgi:N,N'-diacetyllegionaminate synthase
MKDTIQIGNQKVGHKSPIFIIAEIGINHNGDMKNAFELIDKAKWSGASAVKFQTYITEKRVSQDSPIFDILKGCELSFEQQKELFEYANSKDIIAFSTPFDSESVEFLAEINSPCYKVASFDLVNTPLLRDIAKQKRPVIISRGMANMEEIDIAMNILKNIPTVLLHCVSAYPVPNHSSLNLSTIAALKERYHSLIGYSDHTLDIEASQFAVACGAKVIEKHFTLSQSMEGPDHLISSEPKQLKKLIERCKIVHEMMGSPAWDSIDAEKDILQYRRKN